MNSKEKELELRDALVRENAILEYQMAEMKAKHEANAAIVRSIDAKHSIASRPAPSVSAATNGHTSPHAKEGEYGAQRKIIRAAVGDMKKHFMLKDMAAACEGVPRAKIANALWNMARVGEIRVVRRIGEGVRAKPIYEVVAPAGTT